MKLVKHPKFLSTNPNVLGLGLEDLCVGGAVMMLSNLLGIASLLSLAFIVLAVFASKLLRTYVDLATLLLPRVRIGESDE